MLHTSIVEAEQVYNRIMGQIKARYDPDYNLAPGPQVTHTDHALLTLIELQQRRIEFLEHAIVSICAHIEQ